MMYPFMTLDDDSEIVHSKMKEDGRVKVYIEKPDARDCFHHAACWLPGYDWEDISGFTEEEIVRYDDILKSTAHLIIRFSQEGGLENASGFTVGSYWVFFWANESKLNLSSFVQSRNTQNDERKDSWSRRSPRCHEQHRGSHRFSGLVLAGCRENATMSCRRDRCQRV